MWLLESLPVSWSLCSVLNGGDMVQVIRLAEAKFIECGSCKSLLSYQYTDIEFRFESIRVGGPRGRTEYITCPVCKFSIKI
ncbi:hypothetical protein [Pseudomonas phage vB_PseuGesM_254]|uniref:Uncharacterized protein n=1 Tax=Pseudomonas phage vB_PseuGesM_254 TaxID=3092638 RepID=A0AAX4G6B6_9CAUD|nr:hypothetical protein [Pseudomonas phage PseuGes_254]